MSRLRKGDVERHFNLPDHRRYKFVEVSAPAPAGRAQAGGTNKLTAEEMDNIYKSLGALESVNDEKVASAKVLVNSTYGEMTFDGMETLIREANIGPNDVFVDLGSGNGRAVIQTFVNAGTRRAYGIEFHPERSYNSERALKKVYQQRPECLAHDRICSFQLQNIKDVYTLGDATVIYMCSTCYPEELLDAVYEKVKQSKNLRCIITHKQYDKFKEFLPKVRTVTVSCTWNPKLSWFLYSV